ncbi:MAG TPA: hypothetical protein VLM85_06695 [Polyangiaceae bacterium]|nr:hypothetical protein [Polyangiaceae bacterium]
MGIQIVFALLCFALGSWLVPRWRRMRARGSRQGAYWFVTPNLFGSFAFGVALLWGPGHVALARYAAWRDARYLAQLPIRCDRTGLEIRNDSGVPRHVTLDDVALQSISPMLGVEPQSWYVAVEPRARDIAPGESARFELTPVTNGPCAGEEHVAFVIAPSFAPRATCDRARFHITSGNVGSSPELDTRATCDFR